MIRPKRNISGHRIPLTPSSEPAKTHHSDGELQDPSSIPVGITKEPANQFDALDEATGREKLKRHRLEVAGRVWIPDLWGQEKLMKDWIDCSAFNASLVPAGILSARAALVEERQQANSGGLRLKDKAKTPPGSEN
ncbi:hypothetical protein BVC80_1751g151 [Macleaya cordata]|uniref:Protein BIC1 n=1 Tax=Macleaya cordata TaxID=56857 RepID=A0A200QHQ0_MACCD|nr:hypothetical protein BVC80_1751g151 [Macleaya cordata]